MSTTFLTRVPRRPVAMYNDGTNLIYSGANGKIYKLVISSLAETLYCELGEKVTAIVYDGSTYFYVGTSTGNLRRITATSGAITAWATFGERFTSGIASLGLNSTNLYVGLDNGKLELKDLS